MAGVALLLYLLTLNHWVSFSNLNLVARSSGWVWGPELYSPLFYVITYPFRWLPAASVPIAFNLFSMVCGMLSLALLARSVALLPYDRTQDQRLREKNKFALLSIPTAWIPPVLAVLLCGLQITFWENATSGASDLFDLLLLAYIIRSLLEFRIDRNDSWIFRAALVCGAAMANSWLMFVLFPAFLIAVFWIKGLEFFNLRFLLRTFLCGVAGLLFYLLLPTLHVLSAEPMLSFWQALKTNLASDKQFFVHFVSGAPIYKRLLLAITALLPLLVIGIRWASNFGDPSKVGSSLTTWIFHLAHGALLGFGIWIAFEPVFSPRQLGYSVPALYYLSALTVGYFSGYFLLVFKPLPDRMGRTTPLQAALNHAALAVIVILLLVVPAGLLYRNLPQIRMSNGPAVKEYASHLVQHLPDHGVVLSDDSRKLFLAEAALTQAGRSGNYFFLDTDMLTYPGYHAFQQKLHAEAWPALVEPQRTNAVGGRILVNLLARLTETNTINYLHPSFGYYFEVFDQRPQGLSLNLKFYPTNSISGPTFTETEIARNEKFWNQNKASLDRLARFINPPAASTNVALKQAVLKKLHIRFQPNATATALGSFYSQGLNFWGVQLNRAGKLKEAQHHFESAIALFPENIAARNNLALNSQLKTGEAVEIRFPKSMEEELGRYRSWVQVLRDTGPFDDPTHCFSLALTFAQGNLYRQAAQQLERVHTLAPDNAQASFWLARLYIMNQMPAKSQALLAGLRDRAEDLAAAGIRRIDFMQTEVSTLFVDNKSDEANQLLQKLIEKNPKDQEVLATVVQISSVFKSYTNALLALDQLLKLNPDDIPALTSKGVFNLQAGNFSNAIPPLNRVLSLQSTNYGVQLYRAVAYLKSEKLDEAQKDYEQLQKVFPNSNDVNSGLGEIAWLRKDTNSAVRYYELCLKNVPAGSDQAKFFSDRINSLKTPASP
jgi:Flp pilus assembly protein TadD